MRLYRSVSTYIWNDDKFPFVSDDCQLVWFHIFTNPLSSPLGVFRASLAGLAEDKNRNGAWPHARYMKAFREGLRQGFLKHDEKALLISFPKYFSPQNQCNHPQSPNVVLSWGERFHDLPDSPLKEECYQTLKALLQGKGEAFREAFVKGFGEAYRQPSPNTDSLFLTTKPEPEPKPDPDPAVPVVGVQVQDLVALWNQIPGVTPMREATGAVKVRMEARLKEYPDMEWWKTLFARVQQSDFLCGRKTDFAASLDWVLGPKNLAKLKAGNYDNRQSANGYDALREAFVNA